MTEFFTWKQPIHKCVHLWDHIWLCSTWNASTLFVLLYTHTFFAFCLKFKVFSHFEQAFALSLKSLSYTICKSLNQNVQSHVGSQDQPSRVTALLIAQQSILKRSLPSFNILIYLWIAFACLFIWQALWLLLIHVGIISNSLTWQKGLSRAPLDLIMR